MTRIFVGNLPTDIVEKDLASEFAAYGTVNKVDVKHKRDPMSNDIMSTFAYVTITITDSLLHQCLEEFKNEQFRGRFLTVSVARESFLDKLKREREESTQLPLDNVKPVFNPQPIVVKNPFRPTVQNKSLRTFDSDDVESNSFTPMNHSMEEEYEADGCIKKKSKLFTENGKIKIPSFNGNEIVPTVTTKIERKIFDEKSEKADRKRVESLINMKNTYNQQKKAVQQALANSGPTTNKKIVFDEPAGEIVPKASKKSKPLFDDDADDDDDFDYAKSFENKKQYEGESGARLQKLQSRFQNDQRFKMNENFLDENDDAEGSELQKVDEAADSQSDERKWQYDMLESVIGKKLQPEVRKKSDNQMLRYDPTKNDHEKYEKATKRKARNRETDSAPMKQQKLDDDDGAFQVSKEQFFNVTNQLTSALKPASEGFSLLSMFGRDNDIVETAQKNPYQEITLSKGQQNLLLSGSSMFHDDSSDDEIVPDKPISKTQNTATNEPKQKNSKKNSKAEIWHEPFFIFGSDARLQDGLLFFLPNSADASEDFESKQKSMRSIIKRKINKSIKRVLPRGAKPNKRFGRLVRDTAQ